MGRVEKDLKLEEWNYNYSKEDFLSLIKRHLFIPFFVDGSSCYLSGNTFRWNSELNVLEEEYLECITDEYKMVSKIKELNNKGVSTLLSPERFNSMSSKTRNKMIELMEKFAEEDE